LADLPGGEKPGSAGIRGWNRPRSSRRKQPSKDRAELPDPYRFMSGAEMPIVSFSGFPFSLPSAAHFCKTSLPSEKKTVNCNISIPVHHLFPLQGESYVFYG
jgi:hypothetical protein